MTDSREPTADSPVAEGEGPEPFVLGIMGDSGSGKTTIADVVAALLGPERVCELRLDDYHRFTREERIARGLTALNPMVHNVPLMREHLQLLRRGRPIRNRSYNHSDGSFGPIRSIEPREVVLVRGLVGYPTEELRQAYDLAVFLRPEPELLFRWKLRRDVRSRGYTETEVLKHIAHHLLDAKQFVLPQAERADMVVHYELPDWEAPDSQVQTRVVLRRAVADIARATPLFAGLDGVRQEEAEGEVVIHIAPEVPGDAAREWTRTLFPDTCDAALLGEFTDETGESHFRAPLALVEGLVARLTTLRRAEARG